MSTSRQKPVEGIDWEAVKARLARAADALLAGERPSAEQSLEILAARAQRWAQVPEPVPDASEILELLCFRRGREAFAIETRYVQEVLRSRELTVLPGVPEFLIGVTNLRGMVLAVLDLGYFFGNPPAPSHDQERVIVLGAARPDFGIVADSVDEVTIHRLAEILETPPSVSAQARDYLRGTTSDAMLVLEGASLLEDSRLHIEQED